MELQAINDYLLRKNNLIFTVPFIAGKYRMLINRLIFIIKKKQEDSQSALTKVSTVHRTRPRHGMWAYSHIRFVLPLCKMPNASIMLHNKKIEQYRLQPQKLSEPAS